MKISSRGRYSLEALLFLCLLPDGEYASTRSIAEKTGISEGYLEQLFIPLRKAALVRGIRGAQGGYMPGRPPEKISAGEVLRAVEGALAPVYCAFEESCPRAKTCVARETWTELFLLINETLDSITMEDIVRAFKSSGAGDYSI